MEKKSQWFCDICQHNFKRRIGLENHLNTNKHKAMLNLNKNNIEIEYRKENEELKYKVKHLTMENEKLRLQLSKINKSKTYNNSVHYDNCTFNTIQLNLLVNPHGNENWDYLKEDIVNLMKCVNLCIPEMVKKIHFDKNHPENHNIQFPNKKEPVIRTFNGEEWKTFDKKDVIESLITNLVDKLEDEYGDDFRKKSTQFIQELWQKKTISILSEHKIDKTLRKQVEYSILDGQYMLKKPK